MPDFPIPFLAGPIDINKAFGPQFPPCKMGGVSHSGPCNPHTFCHIHGRHERDLPGDYRACGECWHVWRTVEEFGVDVMRARGDEQAMSPEELEKEWICPLCTHNF